MSRYRSITALLTVFVLLISEIIPALPVQAVGLNEKQYGQLAVGEEYMACLQPNGTVRFDGERFEEVAQWEPLTQIDISIMGTFYGLTYNGLLRTTSAELQSKIQSWSGLTNFAVYRDRTDSFTIQGELLAAVTEAGRVMIAASQKYIEKMDDYELNVSDWNGITSVAVGGKHIVGLRYDGTVIATGSNQNGQCNVNNWKNIVSICAGAYCTIGLKADGTVIVTGMSPELSEEFQTETLKKVSSWKDVAQILTRRGRFFGLTKDGQVLGLEGEQKAAYNYGNFGGIPENWVHMATMAVGYTAIAGFRQDGALVMIGGSQIHNPILCNLTDAEWPHGNWQNGNTVSCNFCRKSFPVAVENPESCTHYWYLTVDEPSTQFPFYCDDSEYTCFKCGKKVNYHPVMLTELKRAADSNANFKKTDVTYGDWPTKNRDMRLNAIRFWVKRKPGYDDTEWIEINLKKQYNSLECVMDILETSTADENSISFEIYADGKLLGKYTPSPYTYKYTIDVTNVDILKISCTNTSAEDGWGVFQGRVHYAIQ